MDHQFVSRATELIENNLFYSLIFLYVISVSTMLGITYIKKDTEKGEVFDTEILNAENSKENVIVEAAGAVNKPGLYKLPHDSRLGGLIDEAGGFGKDASEEWVSKYLNLSAKLTDSQKVYIPFKWDKLAGDQGSVREVPALVNPYSTDPESLTEVTSSDESNEDQNSNNTNINTASREDIDALSGIGPVYAARIIENRPYNGYEEFTEKSGVPQSVLEKIRDCVSF